MKKRNIKASLKVPNNDLFLYLLCSRQKGWGAKIIQDIEKYCKNNYISKIYLKTDVPRLLEYYLDLGFTIHKILNPKEPDYTKRKYLLIKLMNNYKKLHFTNKTRRRKHSIRYNNTNAFNGIIEQQYNSKTMPSRSSKTMKLIRTQL
jgi:hypothetical protein